MYQLTSYGGVVRLHDQTHIPSDVGNRDRLAYDQWRAAGGIPLAADAVAPEVPQAVSRFQARAALLSGDLLGQVDAYMAQPDTDPVTKLAWTDAQEFRRSSPTVILMGTLLGLADADLDNLFITASTITA